ncbi:MAG: hypothetical protein ACRC80_24640 [Waterburya sp.]
MNPLKLIVCPFLLHKYAIAFDHLKALINPDAVLFGSTLLQEGVQKNWFAQRLMNTYNKQGIFSNQQDNL